MPFDYFKRLSRTHQQIYLKSDRISTIKLPQPESFHPLVEEIENALASEDRRLTQKTTQQLITSIIDSLKIRSLKVKVLEKRPSHNWGELQGLYQPVTEEQSDQITVWMRTAQRKQVVAFKTFLRTVLHELCHHLDYEFLGLKETFHTQGFFKRESSLFHQLVKKR